MSAFFAWLALLLKVIGIAVAWAAALLIVGVLIIMALLAYESRNGRNPFN